MRLLSTITVAALGVDAAIFPGLNLLPSFVVDPIVNQVKSTVESIVISVVGDSLPITDSDGNEISTADFFSSLPDTALIELLSSDKTTDPTQWDSDFLNTVLEGQNLPVDELVGYVESAQALIDPEIFANAGISDIADLSGENVLALLEEVVSSAGLEDTLIELVGDQATLDDLKATLESGIDTVDLADPFWTDPTVWTAENLDGRLADLADLGIPIESLSIVTSTLLEASTSDLLSEGVSFDSLTSAFDPCLDVLAQAQAMVFIPKLSQVLSFDWTNLFVNIVGLLNDGSNCYASYVSYNYEGEGKPETAVYLEYASYLLMATEKTIRVFDQIPDVKFETENLVLAFEARLEILDRYKTISYLEYAEKSVEAASFVLNHQFLDMANEVIDFYNMLLDDVSFYNLESYNINNFQLTQIIESIDAVLIRVERELDAFEKLGGQFLEKWILQTYFPNAVIDNGSANPFGGFFKQGDENVVVTTAATTTSEPLTYIQTLIEQIKSYFN